MPELHSGQMGHVLKLCDQFFESTTCASEVKIAIALNCVSLYKRCGRMIGFKVEKSISSFKEVTYVNG